MSEWTKQPPTEPGWYWWRDEIDIPPDNEPRWVYLSPAGLMTENDDVDLNVSPPEELDGEWWPEQISEPPDDE